MIKEFYEKLSDVFSSSELTVYNYFSEKHTYKELYENLKRLNYHLSGHKKKRIVLYGTKKFEVYCAIYGIILSGNTWVPFTPGFPEERLAEMLEILNADIIIYEEKLPERIRIFTEENNIEIWELNDLLLHNMSKDLDGFDFDPDDLAYIMFTSGSTGKPKGVPVTHKNYINFINNAMEILSFQKGDVFSDYHDFAFDISIFYLFCAPLTEGSLSPMRMDQERILPIHHILENKINVWSTVPSSVSRIIKLRPDEKIETPIKIMFLCGEPFSLDVLKYCFNNLETKSVYNFYGLTETGVENFYHKCSVEDLDAFESKGYVPIGKPLKDNGVKISEEKELLLSGCQLTPGYLGGIGKERFEVIDGKRWYHTGDIVEVFKEVYFCKGRIDSQVKLSGYRVELMDIEVHLRNFPGVKEAVCFLHESKSTKMLVCSMESESGKLINIQNLKNELKKELPEYMIPKEFNIQAEMPRNTNGKLDRKQVKNTYSEMFLKPKYLTR